ncbi:hypothetical protein OROHE_017370 [Orobanche hederae]
MSMEKSQFKMGLQNLEEYQVEDTNQLQRSILEAFPNLLGILELDAGDHYHREKPIARSLTTVMCIKRERYVIFCAECRITDYATGAIISNDEVKIKCLFDIGIYATYTGSVDSFDRIYNQVAVSYASNYAARDPMFVAKFIKSKLKRHDDIEIVIGGIGRTGKLQMLHLIKDVGRDCLLLERDFVIMGSGSGRLPTAIPDGNEGEDMTFALGKVQDAVAHDWGSGGALLCASIRDDGTIRKIVRNPVDESFVAHGYRPDIDVVNTILGDDDYVGISLGNPP